MAVSGAFPCPKCQSPIQLTDVFCPECGIDLVTLALVLGQSAAETAQAHLTAEVPAASSGRLGEFLLRHDFITAGQLDRALRHQSDLAAQGRNLMLGEVLVGLGAISQADLDRAIVEQLVSLQSTLRESNRLLARRVAERTAELEQAVQRVQEINQLKLNFMSNISHELRTPLTHIHGYISLMNEGMLGEFNRGQQEILRATGQAVGQLQKLIVDLIDYVSAAPGEISIQAGAFSLSDLAESVVRRSAMKLNARHVVLEYKPPDRAISAQGDMEKLGWVLLQLVDNAIKFTPAGGSVELVLSAAQSRVRIAVQDTGVGIPASGLPELFQPLRGGAGLGLVMVGRILEAHGSQINVESVEGKGSTFWFELPLA